MNKLKNNRYLPFIIIVVVILLLIILNVVTSEHNNEYKNKKVVFNFEDTEDNTVNETYNTDDTELEDSDSIEETYYEDTQDSDDQESNEISYNDLDIDDSDIAVSDDSELETKLFSSKEQLENIALGYLNQGRKYRKFFKNRELFEKRNEMPISDCSIKSSDLNNKTVTIKCRFDGDDDSLQTVKLQFQVENNKITGVTLK